MKTAAEWLEIVDAEPVETRAGDVGLLRLIERIQADAVEERRTRVEAAAITGLLASWKGSSIPSRDELIDRARAFGDEYMRTTGPRGPNEGDAEIVVQALIDGQMIVRSMNRRLTPKQCAGAATVLRVALEAALNRLAVDAERA